MQFLIYHRDHLFLYSAGIILLFCLCQGQPFQPLPRDSEPTNAPFYISSSGHLCRPFNLKILSVPATPAVLFNQGRYIRTGLEDALWQG